MAEGRARVRTWDSARPRGVAWPAGSDTFGGARDVISRWFATDTAAGRLLPWLPICFGFGVVLYFAAAREPSLWATLPLAAVCVIAAFFAAIGWSSWWLGALLGALQAFFTGTVLVNVLLPVVHPRMGSPESAANQVALIEPPGFLMRNYGPNTFLITLIAHLAYGAIVGWTVRI